ncbi:MAG: glycosyltransferase family 2 protein [Rhodospirillales bacterium]|nr:glycosyltransferase family 2 protein [Rhodospirillales bacterium]
MKLQKSATDLVLSVVIPVYNEAETLPLILSQVIAVLPGVTKEIIVVDDGSRDGTREWLTASFPGAVNRIGAVRNPAGAPPVFILAPSTAGTPPAAMVDGEAPVGPTTIKPLLHAKNGGKGQALRTGFAAATGDIVIIQDADLEYDPGDWTTMLALIVNDHADVVYGSRFYGRPHRVLYFHHYIANKLISYLFNILYNQIFTDVEVCYKMFRRRVLDGERLGSTDFGIEIELSARIARAKKWRIYEMGISYYGRTYDEGKKINWKDGIKALWYILKYRFD